MTLITVSFDMFDVDLCSLKFGVLSSSLFSAAYVSEQVSFQRKSQQTLFPTTVYLLRLNIMLGQITTVAIPILIAGLVILPVVFSTLKPCPKPPADQVHVNTSSSLNTTPCRLSSNENLTHCVARCIVPCTHDLFHSSTTIGLKGT